MLKRYFQIIFLVPFGCTNLDLSDHDFSSKGAMDVYPVPVAQQFENAPPIDGIDEATPTTTNAIAYARYALSLTNPEALNLNDAVDLASIMASNAEAHSRLDELESLVNVVASKESYDSYFAEIEHEARQLASSSLPRLGKQIMDGYAKLESCREQDVSEESCCASLLWLEGFRYETNTTGNYQERTDTTFEDAETEGDPSRSLHPFRHSGLQSWVAYCGARVTDAPDTLFEFKRRFGDYRADDTWTREFHPLSPAKQAGRRIFRKQLPDGMLVSVAESTRDDCTILETETIVRQPHQAARFWVFNERGQRVDHAYFPTRRRGQDAVKFAPSTCMGCHYTLDTRQFNVSTPSFEALNLTLFESEDGPVWRDHRHCASAADRIVEHDLF